MSLPINTLVMMIGYYWSRI